MKTYVISGATSGIGNELVKVFSKENIVFAAYRNPQKLNDLQQISSNIIPFFIDMEDSETISRAAEFIMQNTQKIDTLINAAGGVFAGPVENLQLQNLRKQFEINTFSHLEFSQKLLNKLAGGKIINISSMASFGFFPFIAPYCASKRALDILFNTMSLEFQSDIKIVSVKPGVIATPLWDKSIKLNSLTIDKCSEKYKRQMKYLVENAHKNGLNGMNVKHVTDLIVKIDNMKNPKTSYTIGNDAKFAEIISRLPQEWLNYIIKAGMLIKMR